MLITLLILRLASPYVETGIDYFETRYCAKHSGGSSYAQDGEGRRGRPAHRGRPAARRRRPFTSIGRELGISEAAVRQRVARLQAAGIMQVVAVADPMALGYQAMAMVGISVDGRARKQVAEAVGACPRCPTWS
jgi:hypothetical protein